MRVYGALAASLLLGFVPILSFAVLSAVLFLVTLVYAYIIRNRATEHDLAHNHATYIIRTIWIVSLICLVTVALASVYMLSYYDPSALMGCVSGITAETVSNMAATNAKIAPCMDQFMEENRVVFYKAGAIAIVPVVLYLLYRLSKGLSRASRGYRVADVKSWF